MEAEIDGHTYRLDKLGTRDALECLKYLQEEVGFFEPGKQFNSLVAADHDALERRLFRERAHLLNEQGDWVPLGKELVAKHFEGRVEAYFGVLWKQIMNNFESFLAGGWATSLGGDESDLEVSPQT